MKPHRITDEERSLLSLLGRSVDLGEWTSVSETLTKWVTNAASQISPLVELKKENDTTHIRLTAKGTTIVEWT